MADKKDLDIYREDRNNNPSPQQQRITAKKGPVALSETFEEGNRYPATKATYTTDSGRSYSGEYNPNDKSVELATEKKGKEFGINATKDSVGAFAKLDFKKGGKVSSASKRADGIAQRGKTKGRFR